MGKYQTIDEYVAAEMGDKIVKKSRSPLLGLLILFAGIGLIVLLCKMPMGDILQSVCLTFGMIGAVLGIILTGMCLTKALVYYVYNPTHSRMKQCKCYLGGDGYKLCLEAIGSNNFATLGALQPVTSSNSALSILYSRDHAVALLQAGRYDSGQFEPETPVVCLVGTDVTHVQALCR